MKSSFFYSFLCHLFIAFTHPMLCCAPNLWAHAAQIQFIQFIYYSALHECLMLFFIYSMFYGFCFCFVFCRVFLIICRSVFKTNDKLSFYLSILPGSAAQFAHDIRFFLLQIANENYVALWICIAHNIN